MKNLWRPISELQDRYATNLLLCAPELVDLDCNEHGVGPGYWQDDRDRPETSLAQARHEEPLHFDDSLDYGGFMAAKWNMTNDEWDDVKVNPTHFIIIEGPTT